MREWKIWCKDIREQRIAGVDTGPDGICVIEKSAYDEACAERDALKDQFHQTRIIAENELAARYKSALDVEREKVAVLEEALARAKDLRIYCLEMIKRFDEALAKVKT